MTPLVASVHDNLLKDFLDQRLLSLNLHIEDLASKLSQIHETDKEFYAQVLRVIGSVVQSQTEKLESRFKIEGHHITTKLQFLHEAWMTEWKQCEASARRAITVISLLRKDASDESEEAQGFELL